RSKMAQKCASLLGFSADEEKYASLAEYVKNAFRREFFDEKTCSVKGDCQTATGIMIYHGLAEENEIPRLLSLLISQIERENGHLDFGVLGCKAVLEVLGKYGYADIGLKMLTNKTYPSCKAWIDMGSTTLLECWNGGGSRNHHMFSNISAFFYKYIAGISAAAPAYREIDFRPAYNCGLESAHASIKTPYGLAESGFEIKGGKAVISITVPSSCRGTLYLDGEKISLAPGHHSYFSFGEK
ncbi:MAG: alpha-L-rhamnosidase C-terminal domain-containing protein, partial [Eubacteriales bacterium]